MLKQYIKSWRYLCIALLAVLAYSYINAQILLGIANGVDYTFADDAGAFTRFVQQMKEVLIYAALLIPVGSVVAKLRARYKEHAHMNLREYYVNKLFDKEISSIQEENSATYISNMTNDFSLLETNLVENIYEIGSVLIEFIVGMWVISHVSEWVLVAALVLVTGNIFLMRLCNNLISRKIEERSTLFDRYTVYLKEVLGAFHVIKSNNLEGRIQKSFYKKSKKVQQKGYEIERDFSYIYAIQNMMTISMYISVMLLGAYLVIIEKSTFGGLVLIMSGLDKVIWPVQQLYEKLPKTFTIKPLVTKLEKTLSSDIKSTEVITLDEFKEEVKLVDIDFAYEDQTIFEGVNLTFEKGKKYLIIGPSGKGKSTLLKLLRKYIAPGSGEIYIDGHRLDEITSESYFSHITNIEQNVFIFEDTLRNNLTLYKVYSDEVIDDAIKQAGLSDFVKSLPEGLDTMLYQNGKNLSGGERSRIVIARGLLAKASILLMDEAFAALDMERAKEIEKSVLALEGVTVFNVSHVMFEETKDDYDSIIKVNNRGVEIIQ